MADTNVRETLSEAEKAQLLAEANVRPSDIENVPAPEPAQPETQPAAGGFGESNQITSQLSPDMEPVAVGVMTDVSRPMTPASGHQSNDLADWEWGPYNDYNIVNTGFGEYAVEKGKILFFEIVPVFNQKAGMFVETRQPRYRIDGQTKDEAIEEFRQKMASRPVRG